MVSQEKPEEAISKIFKNLKKFKLALVCQSEVTKEETDVEKYLQQVCQEHQANFIKIWGSTFYHLSDLPFSISAVPNTYTEFRKRIEERVNVRHEIVMPEKLKPVPTLAPEVSWGQIPSHEELNSTKPQSVSSSAFPFKGGETASLDRLKSYLWQTNAVSRYKETRNGLIGTEYSTKFSPWLALGCISPRRIHWELAKYERERTQNQSTYWVRFELLWRDYFKFVSMKFGDRIFYPSGMKGKPQQWKKDMSLFEAWRCKHKNT